jgi:hypothetical protein
MNNSLFFRGIWVLFFAISFSALCGQQRTVQLGGALGGANYSGDLSTDELSTILPLTLPAGGVYLKMYSNPAIQLKVQLLFAQIQGSDALSQKEWQIARNLDFRSSVFELSTQLEFHPLHLLMSREPIVSPYFFGGAGLFYFNPTTKFNEQRIDLRPLGTEGQGLENYPEKQYYSLTSVSIPIGAGVSIQWSPRITVSVELGWHWTFTDYLDDVSGTYADYNALYNGNGQLAALLAYREHELTGVVEPYPFAEGAIRGNPDVNDIYALGLICISYTIQDSSNQRYRGFKRKKRHRVKCPSF